MASNREEPPSFSEDRNQADATFTRAPSSDPIYVEGTPSKEVMFKLPPLQRMGPAITTSGLGDVSAFRGSGHTQFSTSHYGNHNQNDDFSYQSPVSEGVTTRTYSTIFGSGVRDNMAGGLNFDSIPSVGAASSRNSMWGNGGNLFTNGTRRESLGNLGTSRLPGDRINSGGMQNGKGVKPGTFDGTGSWSDYLIQFNLIAEYYQWGDYEKALQLATHLRGIAQGVLGDLSTEQRTNFKSLTSALAARLEPVHQSELHRAKIKSRIRRKEEPIVELAQDIRKLVRLAYPSATSEVKEQLSKDCFMDSLNDYDIEWAVLQGKLSSVEDALKLALEYEAFQKGRHGRYGDVRTFTVQGQDIEPQIYNGKVRM